MQEANEKEMTFWDHLDELRKVFFRIAIAVILLACIAFLNKELLFDIVLAPQQSDFILYRFFNRLAADFSMPSLQVEDFHVELINIQLTSQFMIHMSTAFYAGLLLASPYIIYLLFGFISPALHYDSGVFPIYYRHLAQLFRDLSAFFPFFGNLSGQ